MIEFKNMSSGYGYGDVIKAVNLQISKGKLISVIGPNGSGKSTLIKTANGMITPSDGTVCIDGTDIASMSRLEIARKAAYLAQGRSVPDMTVGQMVLHGRFPHIGYPRRYSADDRRIATESLQQVGILHLADTPLRELSGGIRQNAYIAMALAQNTDYILLDEPTTYLDISNQLSVIKILRTLSRGGKGILAVMHDLPLAFTFSDAVAVVAEGRVKAFNTPQKLYASDTVKDVFGAELGFCSEGKYYYYKYGNILKGE